MYVDRSQFNLCTLPSRVICYSEGETDDVVAWRQDVVSSSSASPSQPRRHSRSTSHRLRTRQHWRHGRAGSALRWQLWDATCQSEQRLTDNQTPASFNVASKNQSQIIIAVALYQTIIYTLCFIINASDFHYATTAKHIMLSFWNQI